MAKTTKTPSASLPVDLPRQVEVTETTMAAALLSEMSLTIPEQIVDDETGEVLIADPNKVEEAIQLIVRARFYAKELADIMCRFFDEKLHLYLGLTKEEACKMLFGMAPSTARNIQYINRALDGRMRELEYLGVRKMKAIADIPETQRNELLQEGEVRLATGEVIRLSELADMRLSKLEEKVRMLNHSNSNLKNRLREEEKIHRQEVESLKDEIASYEIDPKDKDRIRRVTKTRQTRELIAVCSAQLSEALARLETIELGKQNEGAAAELEGLLVTVARRIIDLEAMFGLHLGAVKSDLPGQSGQEGLRLV